MSRKFEFDDLRNADLVVDAIYEWGPDKSFAYEPLQRLLGCSNTGGFRQKKRKGGKVGEYAYVVLYSTKGELDWPDNLDELKGLFTYYGDNRDTGHELNSKRGNRLLGKVFGLLDNIEGRLKIPPFFVFTKLQDLPHARFRGLAVPGHPSVPPLEQLIAVWKASGEDRFQNYKASFAILDAGIISRQFINDLLSGNPLSENAPLAWKKWIENGNYDVLKAPQIKIHRSKDEQLPKNGSIQKQVLDQLWRHFKSNWRVFEFFSAKLVELMGFKVVDMAVTERTKDGGIDAIGRIALGHGVDDIQVEFALEAKRFEPGKSVTTKHTSRLISRLKHRQIGFLVTTSHVAQQAYTEVREDGHPVIIVSGLDIANILIEQGLGNPRDLETWLKSDFPVDA